MLKITPKSVDWSEVSRKDFGKKFQSDPVAAMQNLTETIPCQLLDTDWLSLHNITTKQHQYRLISVVLTAAINTKATASTARFIHALAHAGIFSSLLPLDTQSCFHRLTPPKQKGMNDPCRILGETLSYCIKKGDETIASLLIDENRINNELFFLKACRRNLPQVIEKIAPRLSEETKNATLTRGLVLCCEKGSVNALKTLLALGANPISDYKGVYPIHAACRHLENDCLNILLPHLNEAGMNVREGMTGHTPLQVLFNQLERSYDMEKRARDNLKILEMASVILTLGAHPDAAYGTEASILHDLCGRWSVFDSEIAFAELLINAGLSPTSQSRRGSPIERLFQSQPMGGGALFSLLLKKGETPYSSTDRTVTWIKQCFSRKKSKFLVEIFKNYSSKLAELLKTAGSYSDFIAAIPDSAGKIVEDCKKNQKNPLEFAWFMQEPTIKEALGNAISASEMEPLEKEIELHYGNRFL